MLRKAFDQVTFNALDFELVLFMNLWVIFSVEFKTTFEPDLKSDSVMSLSVVEDSDAGDVIEALDVAAEEPEHDGLPKVVQELHAVEVEISLENAAFLVTRVFPFWLDALLEQKYCVNNPWVVSSESLFKIDLASKTENLTEVNELSEFIKLDEVLNGGEGGHGFHVNFVRL